MVDLGSVQGLFGVWLIWDSMRVLRFVQLFSFEALKTANYGEYVRDMVQNVVLAAAQASAKMQ